MGLSDTFLRIRDRVKDTVSNFFYPQEEFPEEYEMPPRESPRRAKDVAPVPQTPQMTSPVYTAPQDGFRQGYMPPRQAENAEQPGPSPRNPDNLVYFPGAEEEKAPEKDNKESAVRVINVRAVTDCYSAITQLRLGDMVVMVMEQVSDPAEMRHYVDMLSGACYSLRATITKLSRHGAYLICPSQCRVYVDAATNQLNMPNRPASRQPLNPLGHMQQGMNPFTPEARPYDAPYRQPQSAAAYAQPQTNAPFAQQPAAQQAFYQPPRQQQTAYFGRNAVPESENTATAAQAFADGYMPDAAETEVL